MRIYRHNEDTNRLVIDVRDSPIMHDILRKSDFAGEMEYDEHQHWFIVTVDLYQRIRDTLTNDNTPYSLEPRPKKRVRTPTPTVSPPPPAPVPVRACILRTTPTQTEHLNPDPNPNPKPVIFNEQGTQTEAETVSIRPPESMTPTMVVPPVMQDVPRAMERVIPVPTVLESSIPSPSAVVVAADHTVVAVHLAASSAATLVPPLPLPALPPSAAAPSIRSGYTDWKDVCLRRLAIREMLLQQGRAFLNTRRHECE